MVQPRSFIMPTKKLKVRSDALMEGIYLLQKTLGDFACTWKLSEREFNSFEAALANIKVFRLQQNPLQNIGNFSELEWSQILWASTLRKASIEKSRLLSGIAQISEPKRITYPGVLVTLLNSCLAIIGEILVKGGHISIFSGGLANIKVLGLFLSSLAVYTLLWHLANCDK